MKSSRFFLMIGTMLLGVGVFAAEMDGGPGRGPEGRRGRRPGRRPDIIKILQLNEQETAAVKKTDETFQTECKTIRDKAQADAQKSAAAAFDTNLKLYKEAAARLTDKAAKEKAEKMLAGMEKNRERFIEMQARRALMPERNMMRGPRPEGPRPEGSRPMPPPAM